MRHGQRFTVYDMMEQKGVFDANPANVSARDHTGLSIYKKQEYPKMLYDPNGTLVVTKPAEAIATPFGPKWVGEEKQLINKIVQSKEEEDKLIAAGWHQSPVAANRARAEITGEPMPQALESPYDQQRLEREDENMMLRKQLAEAQARNIELEHAVAEKPKK